MIFIHKKHLFIKNIYLYKIFIHKKHSFKEDASLAYLALFAFFCVSPIILPKSADVLHDKSDFSTFSFHEFVEQGVILYREK